MMNINSKVVFSILLFCFATCFSYFNFLNLSLVLLIIASVIALLYLKSGEFGYSSVTFIFSLFTIVYGLSGLITAIWGDGLAPIYGSVYNFPKYITAFSLSEIGLLLGFTLYNIRHNDSNKLLKRKEMNLYQYASFLKNISFVLIIIGVLFQLINTFRVGGFSALFLDKAVYQAKENSLFLTLPSSIIIELAFTCFSLYIGILKAYNKKINKAMVFRFLLCFLPYFFIVLLLGQRGKLANLIIIVFLGIHVLAPLKKISKRLILTGVLLYALFVFIFVNRGIVQLLKTDSDLFFAQITDFNRYVNYLNPGANEFDCNFGNFNKFVVSGNYNFRLGESYLKGLVVAIPSFLYPGTKPQQLAYEFRDTYFPSEAQRSNIAGTGFSAILEAYWNFGYIGVLLVYVFFGYITMKIDYNFAKQSLMNLITVMFSSNVLISFSRHQLGSVISSLFYNVIYVFIFVFLLYYSFKKRKKGSSYNEQTS